MAIIKILLLSLGLSADAFAVAICKGVSCKNCSSSKVALTCAIWFTLFQSIFPIVGYFLGASFNAYFDSFDHYIIFGILLILGLNLIFEAFSKKHQPGGSLSFSSMLAISLATSLDSLAVGVTLALEELNLWLAIVIFAAVTFTLSVIGAILGCKCGEKFKKHASIIGGTILILIGIQILIEHLLI